MTGRRLFSLALMVVLLLLGGSLSYAQKNSFDKIIGRTAINLEPGSFRFSLGADYQTDKWGDNDYASLVIPIDTALGLTENIELDLGVKYNKAYAFLDGITLNDNKYSYHDLYAGVRWMMNPEDMHNNKPAYGFWLGMYIPTHKYETMRPEAHFLWSSSISGVFSWNFNLGWAYYLRKVEYPYNHGSLQQEKVSGGMQVSPNFEIGYILNDFTKIATGFDVKIHFLSKRYFVDGSKEELEEFSSFKWVGAVRFKPGKNVPLVFDAGVKIGLNKHAEETFSVFFQLQLIPNSSDAVW